MNVMCQLKLAVTSIANGIQFNYYPIIF